MQKKIEMLDATDNNASTAAAEVAADSGAKQPIEQWAAKHATPAWLFKATKLAQGWAIGAEITEKNFTEAVAATAHGRIG